MRDRKDPFPPSGDSNVRWWLSEGDDLRVQAQNAYSALLDRDKSRRDSNLHHLRLYGNLPLEGSSPFTYNRVNSNQRATFNIIANVCDFVTSRIGKQQPMPKPLPMGGNYSLHRKARMLERFFHAQFRISRAYEQLRRMFLDGCVFGTGILKVYQDGEQIRIERVFPSEILVDHHEALYGEPRQLMQEKWISRDVLLEMFATGDKKEAKRLRQVIQDAGKEAGDKEGNPSEYFFADEGVNDQVRVIEAWHLPSGTGAKDGKHVIFVDTGVLLEEQWEYDHFPFVFFRWKERLRGFWGVGLAEELNGIQVEVNLMLMKIQKAFHMMAVPRIFVEAGSKVSKTHLQNEIGLVVPFTGTPPIVAAPQLFHPEFFAHLERLYQKAYEIAGINQDAASPKFSGEESGIARQHRHDIETERFSLPALAFEQCVMDLSQLLIVCAEELAAEKGSFAVSALSDRKTVEQIDWEEIRMEEDQYVLQVLPVSALPTLPSARMDRVITMMEAGLVEPQEAKRLLDFPDLERHQALDAAASDDIDRIIELILDEGEYEPPEPYMDLDLALKKVQMALNFAKRCGVEEDRLELLRRFLTQTHRLQQKAAVEQQKLAMMAGEVGGNASALPPGPGAPPAPGIQGAPPTAAMPQAGVI